VLLQEGLLSQHITVELIDDSSKFEWSAANIALAAFVKLKGIPWILAGKDPDQDLIIGLGRAGLYDPLTRQATQFIGFTACFSARGIFKFVSLADVADTREEYLNALRRVVVSSLEKAQQVGGNVMSLTLHMPKEMGQDEDAIIVEAAKSYANLREALGDDIDIAMHCTGQFDTRSAIGLCKAIEPIDPMWIEDPLTVRYSEAWLELKRSTRVPLLAGEKVELVEGFRPYLDNQVLAMIHPDVAYSGGITGCRKIADYAALTRTPMGMHSGPCSLIRFYASMHLGAAMQNFFKVENALGAFRGNKEKMAQGPEPVVRKSVFPVPEGPGLGLDLNEDWLRAHIASGDTWWG